MPSSDKQAFGPSDFATHYISDEKTRAELKAQSEKDLENTLNKVPSKERRYITIMNITAPLGLGVSATLTILLRFMAPLAAGGAALAVSIPVFMGLAIGGTLLALCIGFAVHKFFTKEAIKDIASQIKQIEEYNQAIIAKKTLVDEKKCESFEKLAMMKRHGLNPTELQKQIHYFVGNPDHISLLQIPHQQEQKEAIKRTIQRQTAIKTLLDEALASQIPIETFIQTNKDSILACFPSTGHMTKDPSNLPIAKPTLIASTFGFTGTFSLSFTSMAIITGLTTVTVTFPPVFIVLALSAVVSAIVGYAVYQNRLNNAKRSSEINYQRKTLDYLKETNLNLEQGINNIQNHIIAKLHTSSEQVIKRDETLALQELKHDVSQNKRQISLLKDRIETLTENTQASQPPPSKVSGMSLFTSKNTQPPSPDDNTGKTTVATPPLIEAHGMF